MATTDFVVKNGLVVNENAVILETTDSSSKDTGALVVEGGAGIEKKLYVGTDLAVGSNTTLTGDLAVNGGDITTNVATFNLVNTTATTVNFAGAATTLEIGAATGTTNINNNLDVDGDVNIDGGDLTVSTSTFNIANTTATTGNLFGAGTAITIGATTGTTTIRNANTVVTGDLAVNGGDITTGAATFNLVNATATTVNFAGAATDVQIGAATGTTNVNNNLDVDGDVNIDGGDLTVSTSTFNIANTTATTGNLFGAGTAITIGATTGTTTIRNANTVVTGDLAVNGGDVTTTSTTFNLVNATATTVNFAGAASTFNAASSVTGAQTANIATGVTASGSTKTVNIGTGGASGSTTNINLGSTNGGTVTANAVIKTGLANSATALDFASTDGYASMRVIRNSAASTYNDGMWIGYGNTSSGSTRLFGGGSTTVSATVNSHATAATSSTTGSVVINGGLGINNSVFSDGLVTINRQAAINTTTPGFAQYGLHFQGQTTADFATGITFNGGTGTTGAQAGIYVQGSGSYGTKMYFGTTDDYGTGSKTRLTIQHTGQITMLANIASTNTTSGTLAVTGGVGVSGAIYAGSIISTTGQLQSTVATGTAPLSVASTTLVTNLNADLLDGLHITDFDSRYVNVTGDTMTGNLTFTDDGEGVVWSRNTDGASIRFYNTADGDTNSRLEFNISDNGNEYFIFTDTTGVTRTELLKILPNGTNATAMTFKGNTVWHAGNDGALSGLDADTLDGFHASNFLTAEADTLASVTGRGFITRASSGTFATNTQGTPGLEVYGAGTVNPAYMTFHRPGNYAVRFGLDGTDLFVGGWSMGNVAYRIWHQGNDGAGSGLDADLLDGVDWATTTKTVNGTFVGTIANTTGGGDNNAPFRFSADYSGWVSLLAGSAGSADGWGTFWAGNDNATYRYFDTANPNEYVFVGAGSLKASIDLDNGQSYFGTSVRSPIFYDSDNTSFFGDFASQSSLNTAITNGISSRDFARQVMPEGASFTTSASTVTGAVKIRLPASSRLRFPMLSFTVQIYTYLTGRSYTYRIGGHYSGSQWYNVFAYALTDSGPILNVRFGYDGDFLCVWIGETGSSWSYPQVFVTDFQNGYSSIDNTWLTGWNVSFQTAFNTVTNGPYSPAAFWNSNNDGAGSGLDADLLDGFNSSQASTASTVAVRDSSGDINVRLVRSEFANQSTISGAMAFRVNNSSDNYIRFCSDAAAIQTFLNVPTRTGGNASGTWGISITGNAVNLSTNRTNWSTNGTISAVVGQLAWKNYSNSHTIFDASAGTSPDGGAVNNTNAAIAWSGSYPTLMGWNGSSTYGVRVDSARVSDNTSGNAATVTNGVYTVGNQNIAGVKTFTNGTASTNTTTGSVVVQGGLGVSGNVNVGGALNAISKSFLIDHPTKAGMKLRYGSLEGPENGVYVRGKLVDATVIKLPDYWTGLVHADSITVNLTAAASGQQLYVERVENNCVYIVNETGKPINCFYTVYGERKDVEKLLVEIE
jgi:hypothetical protein